MNEQKLTTLLSIELNSKIKKISPLSGGDISKAYCIETNDSRYFLKINQEQFALDMFQKEKAGLEEIRRFNIVNVPEVFIVGQIDVGAYLLMEFIEASTQFQADLSKFGIQLAELHSQFGNVHGWSQDNYIGSLHQSNTTSEDWNEFFVGQRLLPQIKHAFDKNLLEIKVDPTESNLLNACNRLFENPKPSPLHGDLWNGNYVIGPSGQVYLIDPAFYYGHHEVDIAMSKLFGGFSNSFYTSYYSVFPKQEYTAERIQFLQLYYLLVHLNLFGKSYLSSVMSILKDY